MAEAPVVPRSFLFLQGPTNLLFARAAEHLRALGHEAHRVHVCLGDRVFWRGPGAASFRGTADEWPGWIDDFYARHHVTDIVLLGEKRERHRVAIERARERGIAVTVTDFGYLRPDWIVVERDGLNGDSRFPRDPAAILRLAAGLPAPDRAVLFPHRPVRQAIADMAFHLSTALVPWAYPHFARHTLRHPLVNYAGTGLRLARSPAEARHAKRLATSLAGGYFLFAMQMEDDFSLRAYSRYPDMESAMEEAASSFASHGRAGHHLLFKLHPLDPGLRPWRDVVARLARKHGLEGRMHFLDGGDLDALLRGSSGLLTVNSTAGIRAIELGVPTMALGETIYTVPGLAFEGGIDAFWKEARAPDEALARAFLAAIGATLHVRGSMYDPRGIEAAARGMAYRLHHGLVNVPLAQVLSGEPLSLPVRVER